MTDRERIEAEARRLAKKCGIDPDRYLFGDGLPGDVPMWQLFDGPAARNLAPDLCRHPEKCIGAGYCKEEIACND